MKLSFGVISWCLGFFFFKLFGTFLWDHLNFQNLFVWINTNMIFVSYQKLWIPKKYLWTCEIMHNFGRKGKHTNDYWHNGFMSKGYAQCVICMKQKQKWRHVINTGKHMILVIRKAHLTKGGIISQVADKTKIDWNTTKSKLFCGHDQTEAIIFGHNRNRLHSPTLVKILFRSASLQKLR
jgi:hypothetical protein